MFDMIETISNFVKYIQGGSFNTLTAAYLESNEILY